MSREAGRRSRELDRRSLPVYAAGETVAPFVITGMDEMVERDTVWEPHAHPTHELLWTRQGASNATIGSRTWTITPTVGLWIPAGVIHTGHMFAGTWYRTAHFDVRAASSVPDEPVAIEVTPLLGLLLVRLADRALEARSRDLTEQLVFDLLAPSSDVLLVQLPQSALLRPIVDAHASDPADARTLGDWASELGVSERTITRAFRAETGMSFAVWQAVFRAQRAVVHLVGGMSVDEVAERVGYRSASAFGVAFRRTTGVSPTAFRLR